MKHVTEVELGPQRKAGPKKPLSKPVINTPYRFLKKWLFGVTGVRMVFASINSITRKIFFLSSVKVTIKSGVCYLTQSVSNCSFGLSIIPSA